MHLRNESWLGLDPAYGDDPGCRTKLRRLIDSPLLEAGQSGRIVEGIRRFDQFYGHPAKLSDVAASG